MKFTIITMICATLAACGGANAQTINASTPTPTDARPADRGPAKAQSLLSQYRTVAKGKGLESRNILEGVSANGLPITADNVQTIRTLLASNVSIPDKAVLARILGRMYTPDNKTGLNNAVIQDLKGLAEASDIDLAREAVFAYSRLAYFPDRKDVLHSAKRRGVLDDDGYFGEIAHIIPFAPGNAQSELIADLESSKNRYAGEVIAMHTSHPDLAKNIAPEAKVAVARLLDTQEPTMPSALGYFDFADAVKYAHWLKAVANMKASDFNKRGNEIVFARLSDEKTDPRKIMAYLSSQFGQEFINSIGQRHRFEGMLRRITLYAKQHPQNKDMADIVNTIKGQLAALKG